MNISRRHFHKFALSAGAVAAMGMLGRGTAYGATSGNFRAMVGVFLFGGNDGWNMVVPTDAPTYNAYTGSRGSVALPQGALSPLSGSNFALHGAMSSLVPLWDSGAMGVILNAGTLAAPLTKASYLARPDLRPTNLMSHSDEQEHWQGLRAQSANRDGFMGRINDLASSTGVPPVISFGGNNIALIGQRSRPLVMPSTGMYNYYKTNNQQVDQALAGFAGGSGLGAMTELTAQTVKENYAMSATANAVLSANSSIASYFRDPSTGAELTSDIAAQLKRAAIMIEARATFGHSRQSFMVTQGGYDTHDSQVAAGAVATGRHASLLKDLALALSAFYQAMQSLGLAENVTTFTMSDFGRTFKGNGQYGTDHAWGSNHLVIGGGIVPRTIFGAYPDPTLGGNDDISNEGRFLPTLAQEEYIGAILKWYGVSDTEMGFVVPNWSTWSSNGRGPIPLYR